MVHVFFFCVMRIHYTGLYAATACAALSAPSGAVVWVVLLACAAAQCMARFKGRNLQSLMNTTCTLVLLARVKGYVLLLPVAVFMGTAYQDSAVFGSGGGKGWGAKRAFAASVIFSVLAAVSSSQHGGNSGAPPLPHQHNVVRELVTYAALCMLSFIGNDRAESLAGVLWHVFILASGIRNSYLLTAATIASGCMEYRLFCNNIQAWIVRVGKASGTALDALVLCEIIAASACSVLVLSLSGAVFSALACNVIVFSSCAALLFPTTVFKGCVTNSLQYRSKLHTFFGRSPNVPHLTFFHFLVQVAGMVHWRRSRNVTTETCLMGTVVTPAASSKTLAGVPVETSGCARTQSWHGASAALRV